MNMKLGEKSAYLIGLIVVSIAITGYYVGLSSPMNPALESIQHQDSNPDIVQTIHDRALPVGDSKAFVATSYSDMHLVTKTGATQWLTQLDALQPVIDPDIEIVIAPGQKELALATREQNRAFNGAPPTIPHPVDPISTAACIVCHGNGVVTESLRIPKMSHSFLENCTQCHVENSTGTSLVSLFRENDFVGLPAPTGGPRAFESAPPMIPHSTWMRDDCTSCHGNAGLLGIRTTHPWRQNCQQCHAPSSMLDQVQLHPEPRFLAPPSIRN